MANGLITLLTDSTFRVIIIIIGFETSLYVYNSSDGSPWMLNGILSSFPNSLSLSLMIKAGRPRIFFCLKRASKQPNR